MPYLAAFQGPTFTDRSYVPVPLSPLSALATRTRYVPEVKTNTAISLYRVVAMLGAGGMGEVFGTGHKT